MPRAVTDCCLQGLTIIQSSILFKACDQGLGKSVELLEEEAQDSVQKARNSFALHTWLLLTSLEQMYYTVQILVVVVLGLSKLSVNFFLLRLTNQAPQASVPCWGRAHCSMDICLDSGCFLAMQSRPALASRWAKLFGISETYIYPKLGIDTDPVCAYSSSDFKSSVPSISYPRLPWFS